MHFKAAEALRGCGGQNCFGRKLDSHVEAVSRVKTWTRDNIGWQENDAGTVMHFAAETGIYY